MGGMEKQGLHRGRLRGVIQPFKCQLISLAVAAVGAPGSVLLCSDAVCCVLPFASVPGHGFPVYLWWLGTSLPVLGVCRAVGTELCQVCAAAAKPDPAGAWLCAAEGFICVC